MNNLKNSDSGDQERNFHARPPQKTFQKYKKLFWYFLLATVLAAAFFVRTKNVIVREFTYDEALYAWSAERLSDNLSRIFSEEITEYHPPLFPLLLAAGRFVFDLPASLLSYSLITVFMSLTGVWGIYLLGAKLSSRFLGAFCSLLLALSVSYTYGSVYLLNDIPFCVLSIFLLLALRAVEKQGYWKNDVFVGLIVSLMICTKYTGLLMVPLVAFFYLFLPDPLKLHARLRKLSVALSVVFFVLVVLVICNYTNRGTVLPMASSFQPPAVGIDEARTLLGYYIFWNVPGPLVFMFVWGCLCILRGREYFEKYLILYIAIGFLSLAFLKAHSMRYGFFIVPSVFLVAGMGASNLLAYIFKNKKFLFVVQVCVVLAIGYWQLERIQLADAVVEDKLNLVPDYFEVAAWINEHLSEETEIISQEPRLLRYYTRINFKRFGGRISPFPGKKKELERVLKEMKGHVILDVNIRRDAPRGSFHPFTNAREAEDFLGRYGYVLKKTSFQRKFCEEGFGKCAPLAAVKIFERLPSY